MKKIMMSAVVALTAACVQAGSVTWTSQALYNANGAKVGATVTEYVYLLADKAAYDALGSDMSDIWDAYGADVKAGGTTAANKGTTGKYTHKANVLAPNGTATASTTYYGAIVAVYGSGDDMMYYAEKRSIVTGDDGNASISWGTVLTSASGAKSEDGWQAAAVPEPFSGALALLGMAGIALRRKMKKAKKA